LGVEDEPPRAGRMHAAIRLRTGGHAGHGHGKGIERG